MVFSILPCSLINEQFLFSAYAFIDYEDRKDAEVGMSYSCIGVCCLIVKLVGLRVGVFIR